MYGSGEGAAQRWCVSARVGRRSQRRRSRRPRKPMPSPMSANPMPRVSAGTARATGSGIAWLVCSCAVAFGGGVRSGKGAFSEPSKSSERTSSSSPPLASRRSGSRSCSGFRCPFFLPLSGSAESGAERLGDGEAEPDDGLPLALGDVGGRVASRDGSTAPCEPSGDASALAVVRPGRGRPCPASFPASDEVALGERDGPARGGSRSSAYARGAAIRRAATETAIARDTRSTRGRAWSRDITDSASHVVTEAASRRQSAAARAVHFRALADTARGHGSRQADCCQTGSRQADCCRTSSCRTSSCRTGSRQAVTPGCPWRSSARTPGPRAAPPAPGSGTGRPRCPALAWGR